MNIYCEGFSYAGQPAVLVSAFPILGIDVLLSGMGSDRKLLLALIRSSGGFNETLR